MDGVDHQGVAGRRGEGVVEPVQVDAELRGTDPAVLEIGAVAGTAPGIDAEPDAAPRRAPPVTLDLADRVQVQVYAVRDQHIEVALRYVGPGVADLVRSPAALERPDHLSRRAGIDADAFRRAWRTET